MLKKFTQTVAFPVKRVLDGGVEKDELVHFKLGANNEPMVHEVSDEILEHPHFAIYEKAGWVHEADAGVVLQETLEERSARLATRFAQVEEERAAQAPVQAEDDVQAHQDDESMTDEDVSQETDSEESAPKKSKKKR